MNSITISRMQFIKKFMRSTTLKCSNAQNMSRCSTKGPSKYITKNRKFEPAQMSYNSYETTSPDISANPVVIMHGLFGSKQNWRSISKALHSKTKPTRKVIAVDARNHGESPHSPSHRYEDLAEDIREFYREHNIEKAVVLGHSMGGRAMMAFALKYPELVEKAIIVDVSPVTSSPSLRNMGEIFSAMRRIDIEDGLNPAAGRAVANEQIKNSIPDKATRDFILLNLYRDANGSFDWRANVAALDDHFAAHISRFPENLVKIASKFTAPILFIGGSKSDYLTKRNELQKIQQIFPQAELKFLDTGHLVQLEAPNEFIDLVLEFINHK